MAKLTDGYGNEITDLNWLQEHIFDYLPFPEAAMKIDPNWSRHHLHKEVQMNRVFRSQLLIMHDSDLIPTTGWSQGKKFYITKEEVERLKGEYEKRPKRTFNRCKWCGRKWDYCRNHPCKDRTKLRPEFRETIEEVAAYVTNFVIRSQKGKQSFTEFNKQGERKNFRTRKRRNSE